MNRTPDDWVTPDKVAQLGKFSDSEKKSLSWIFRDMAEAGLLNRVMITRSDVAHKIGQRKEQWHYRPFATTPYCAKTLKADPAASGLANARQQKQDTKDAPAREAEDAAKVRIKSAEIRADAAERRAELAEAENKQLRKRVDEMAGFNLKQSQDIIDTIATLDEHGYGRPGASILNRVGLLIEGFKAAEERASDLQERVDFLDQALKGANANLPTAVATEQVIRIPIEVTIKIAH